MKKTYASRLFLTLALSLPVVAWAARHQDPPPHRGDAGDPNWFELIGSMDHMHMAMSSVSPSGSDDADFVRLMLPHHQAAVDMARTELRYGRDPQMRRLAQEIITDQESEIELMRLWLKRNALPSAIPQTHSNIPKHK